MNERSGSGLPAELEEIFEKQRLQDAQHEQRLLDRKMQRRFGVPGGPAMRDYAEHVGYVILQAAEVDLRMAALAALLRSGPQGYPAELLGLSGGELAKSLRSSFQIASPDFDAFVTRYEVAYRRRNQIVHAVRPDGARDGDAEEFERTVRAVRGQKGWVSHLNSARLSVERITVEDLIDFEFELQLLNTAASEWFGALQGAGYGPTPPSDGDSGT